MMLLLSLHYCPLDGEIITPTSANCSDHAVTARADIHDTRGFWGRRQGALFDVRVFHPNAPSYRQTRVASLFRRHELEKNREYEDRIRNITRNQCMDAGHLGIAQNLM